jgi:hypothetical protein
LPPDACNTGESEVVQQTGAATLDRMCFGQARRGAGQGAFSKTNYEVVIE